MGRGGLNRSHKLCELRASARATIGVMDRNSAPGDVPVTLVDGTQVSLARLHGEACIICGAVNGRLVPAGTRHTRGADRALTSWEVVTCVAHITTPPPTGRVRSPR